MRSLQTEKLLFYIIGLLIRRYYWMPSYLFIYISLHSRDDNNYTNYTFFMCINMYILLSSINKNLNRISRHSNWGSFHLELFVRIINWFEKKFSNSGDFLVIMGGNECTKPFYLPPNYCFGFILLVGYTLFLNNEPCSGSKDPLRL